MTYETMRRIAALIAKLETTRKEARK